MTEKNYEQVDLQRMEVQANMLSTFETASLVMTRIHNTVMLLDFSDKDTLQQFYNSLYYFIDGCQGLKEGFKVLCTTYDLELVDPTD
jgi:hypothetical protein